jgi:hypothetical protein
MTIAVSAVSTECKIRGAPKFHPLLLVPLRFSAAALAAFMKIVAAYFSGALFLMRPLRLALIGTLRTVHEHGWRQMEVF